VGERAVILSRRLRSKGQIFGHQRVSPRPAATAVSRNGKVLCFQQDRVIAK
jgi:hypothetical protein